MDATRSEQTFGSAKAARPARRAASHRVRFDARLDAILEAATRVIARDGFEKASMRAIARASGVSLSGLYHYFDAKDRLLFLIQFRAFSALLTEVRARLNGVDDPAEQIRILVRTHVSYVVRTMAALKVCSHELDSLSGEAYEQVRRVRREYYELARSIVARLIRLRPGAPAVDPRIATMSLFGMLNWLYRWYDPKRDRSPATLANRIADQFLTGIAGRPLRIAANGTPRHARNARPRRAARPPGASRAPA